MHIHTVALDMQLPADRVVDLFLLQVHTPAPLEAGGLGPFQPMVSAARGQFLEGFARWLREDYQPANPDRPFFVLIPELSVPLQHLPILEGMATAANRPAFVIAGIEFLNFEQYRALLNTMDSMPSRPDWLANGHAGHLVNAAFVVVRDRQNNIHRFLQTKRNPSDAEALTHFPCDQALLFQSMNQAHGTRLNFCVQICADFTSEAQVRELRRACEVASNGRQLDFTFVIQRNEDQTAAHFKRSVAAYFEPPNAMTDTSAGCLVFVNNANATFGKSDVWGRSMLLFPFARRWRVPGSPTYWLNDQGPFNHQAVVLREPGPTVYWLRYKPQYLVDPIPGAGQPVPFIDNRALALMVEGQAFPVPVDFKVIQPVIHWLVSEWTCTEPAFITELREARRPEVVWTALRVMYGDSLETWRRTFGMDDVLARHVVSLYFKSFPDSVLSKDAEEPQRWSPEVAAGARRFLELYCIMRAGFSPASNLRPRPTRSAHAVVNGSTGLALIWGGGEKFASSLIASAISVLEEQEPQEYDKHLVLLVAPRDSPEPNALAALVAENRREITEPSVAAGDEAQPDEDITQPNEPLPYSVVCDQRIWALVSQTESVERLSTAVCALLGVEAP